MNFWSCSKTLCSTIFCWNAWCSSYVCMSDARIACMEHADVYMKNVLRKKVIVLANKYRHGEQFKPHLVNEQKFGTL